MEEEATEKRRWRRVVGERREMRADVDEGSDGDEELGGAHRRKRLRRIDRVKRKDLKEGVLVLMVGRGGIAVAVLSKSEVVESGKVL